MLPLQRYLPLPAVAFAGIFACISPGAAQPSPSHHSAGGASTHSPAAEEMREATAKMHGSMAVPLTGDPDRDFAAAMIPHHEGAIAMAQIQLKYGKDPVLREMAQEIIAAQQKEISVLQEYLARTK